MDDAKSGQRKDPRSAALADLSGHLVRSIGRHPVRCIVVNVSRNGLGIVCFDELPQGTELILLLRERGIPLKVEWAKADTVRNGVFHVGMSTNDPGVNLVKMMTDDGILKQKPATSSDQRPSGTRDVDFLALRDSLVTAHTTDQSVLQRGGLERLAQTYQAYPIKFQNKSYYVLLPRDIKPAAVADFDNERAAQKQIFIVLASSGAFGKFQFVWPKA